MAGPLLEEQRRLERTIGRIRWGAVALVFVLGPLFPNLSIAAVVGLGIAISTYNFVVSGLSAATRERNPPREGVGTRVSNDALTA